MALPSQMPRTSRVAAMGRGPRRRMNISPRWTVMVVLAVAGGLLTWQLLFKPNQSPSGGDRGKGGVGLAGAGEAAPWVRPESDRGVTSPGGPKVVDAEDDLTSNLANRGPDKVPESPSMAPAGASDKPLDGFNATNGANEPTVLPQQPPAVNPDQALGSSEVKNAAGDAGQVPQSGTPGSAAPGSSAEPPANSDVRPSGSTRSPAVQRLIDQAQSAREKKPLEARNLFNRAMFESSATEEDRRFIRAQMSALNDETLLSPVKIDGDPIAGVYKIQEGDNLVKIAKSLGVHTDWRALKRVNGIADERRIRVGQEIKYLRGPFHAVVDKSDYRLDLYSNITDGAGNRVFIRSFPVGLGEFGSTPLGKWKVKAGSRLVDPHWVNPRTGERFSNSDPKNPIGERWIGLQGVDTANEAVEGFGIHGTIDPESIGHDASMGCVRLLPSDIEMVYELIVEEGSEIEVVP